MPRKDRTFTHGDLTRFACRNLAPEEQAKIVHNMIDSDCFPIEFTPDHVEKSHLPTHESLRPSAVDETIDHGKRVQW